MLVFLPGKSDEPYKKTQVVLDTYVTITADADTQIAKKAVAKAFDRMKEIEDKFNRYDANSEISKVNKLAPGPVEVSADTFKAVKLGLKYSRLSGGSFDITIGPLVSLFDFNKKVVPSKAEVEKAKRLVDYRQVKLDESSSTVALAKKGVVLDLGGVAKGFAADEARKVLKENGIKAGLIDTGSSALAFNDKKDDRIWRVGIRHPRQDEILTVLKVRNRNLSTSGDYQQYFIKNGRRYHHIIDPKTGYPRTGIASVTVIAQKSAAEGDVISTAVFAMGQKRGLEFVEKLKGAEAVLIGSDGTVSLTENVSVKIADQIKLD